MGRFTRRRREEEGLAGTLPLPPGPVTNGEFVPRPPDGHHRAVTRLIRQRTAEAAKRVGMDRRTFLQSSGAVVASLAAFELAAPFAPSAAASRRAPGPPATPAAPGAGAGGSYALPDPADLDACDAVLRRSADFVFDVHTHHVMPKAPWVRDAPATLDLALSMLPSGCGGGAHPLDCVDRAAYLHDLFLASDTKVAMLTDLPNSGPDNAPVPFADELVTEHVADDLNHGHARRLLVQKVVAPNVGPVETCLEQMTAAAESGRLAAFKVYTAWSPAGRGFSLEDPRIGLRTVQHAHDLGIKVFVAHKGLPLVNFDPAFNHPGDMVYLSRHFRDMDFVVYHAAWDPSVVEGPYDPRSKVGIDSLLTALDRHGVPPNSNLWVDIASMWRVLLTLPDQAAHAIGKLLRRVGEDRVMWGTDAIWFGSPQPQIIAMRAFEISRSYQEAYGYPELTPAVKAKLFGLNAARLFGIDTRAFGEALRPDRLEPARSEAEALRAEGALPSPWRPRGPTTHDEMVAFLRSTREPWRPA